MTASGARRRNARPRSGRVIAAVVLLSLAACSGTELASESGGDTAAEGASVTFALSFIPGYGDAGWYSALEQGWFAEEGIDAEIVRGFGSGDTAQRVAAGEAEFGMVDMSALVPFRLNEDVPLVAIGALYTEPPQALVFRSEDGIKGPRDLEGRSIACSAGNANMLMFPAFAGATGIDAEAVEWSLSDPSAIAPSFASGQTDAACHFLGDLPVLEAQSDDDLDYFSFAEHGVEGYSQMLVTTEGMIEEQPDLVAGFVAAAMRGLEFAVANPEEAIDILVDLEPERERDLVHAGWTIVLDHELVSNDDTERHGFGYMAPDRMETTFRALVEAGDLDPGGSTAGDLYTNEFLP